MKTHRKAPFLAIGFTTLSVTFCVFSCARESGGFGHRIRAWKDLMANKRESDAAGVSEVALGAHSENVVHTRFGDRDMILYVPGHMPAEGQRALVVALHGGMGNAQYMQDHMKMDGVAEKFGFIVAYLNGSDAARLLPDKAKAWNAGRGCPT